MELGERRFHILTLHLLNNVLLKKSQLFTASWIKCKGLCLYSFNQTLGRGKDRVSLLHSYCARTLPAESNGLRVQGWSAHSPLDATKRRVAVTHQHFSPLRVSLFNERRLRADHTEVLWAPTVGPAAPSALPHQIDLDEGFVLCLRPPLT